ncbi:MAG: hypothetical protein HN531_09130, partial [Opitutae bacterium]|nr:hypothetical protein [Opitutae bacterium]
GQSIQSAINGAASGDEIVLTAPSAYAGDVSVTGKALTLRSLNPQFASITGNLNVSGLSATQKVSLDNLTVSGSMLIQGAGKIVLTNATVGTNLELNGTTDAFIRRSTVTGTLTMPSAQDGSGNPSRLVILQSTINEKLTSRAAKAWLGYSTFEETYLEGTLEIVGNIFNGRGLGGIGLDLNGSSTVAHVHNNRVFNFKSASSISNQNEYIGIRISSGARAYIRNNSIHDNHDGHGGGTETNVGMGVFVASTAETKILGNTLFNNYVRDGSPTGHANIRAPAQNVTVTYNAMRADTGNGTSPSNLVAGGVQNQSFITDIANNTFNDHFLTNPAGLASGRAIQNAGPPEAAYFDHDGTRNDIGPNGGRNYIPNGRTTDKAIPISFSIAPQIVEVGGTVTIESTGATVK